jgi:EPS-associated MarR family transcriptional regulator
LQETPDLTQRELAAQLGMSLGGLDCCLNALIDKGFVKMQNFQNSKNKFKYAYLLTPQGCWYRLPANHENLNHENFGYFRKLKSLHV